MSEPTYLAQTAEPQTSEQKRAWFRARAGEAKERGCRWLRFSIHVDRIDLLLVEGWPEKPEDEGETRWQFQES